MYAQNSQNDIVDDESPESTATQTQIEEDLKPEKSIIVLYATPNSQDWQRKFDELKTFIKSML